MLIMFSEIDDSFCQCETLSHLLDCMLACRWILFYTAGVSFFCIRCLSCNIAHLNTNDSSGIIMWTSALFFSRIVLSFNIQQQLWFFTFLKLCQNYSLLISMLPHLINSDVLHMFCLLSWAISQPENTYRWSWHDLCWCQAGENGETGYITSAV